MPPPLKARDFWIHPDGNTVNWCDEACPSHGENRRAFSLVELMVVMAIMAIVIGLTGPALTALLGSNGISAGASGLAEQLDRARAYAVARQTYVYVGLGNFRGSAPDNQGQAGVGRVGVFTVTSPTGSSVVPADISNCRPIGRMERLNGVMIGKVSSRTGGLERPNNASVVSLEEGATVSPPMTYPLIGATQFAFPWVLEFSPQGMVRILGRPNQPGLVEIGLQAVRGDQAGVDPNVAVIQLSGLIGRITVFRP